MKCFQEIQSGPGGDESLHLIIALLISSLKKDGNFEVGFNGSSSRMLRLI